MGVFISFKTGTILSKLTKYASAGIGHARYKLASQLSRTASALQVLYKSGGGLSGHTMVWTWDSPTEPHGAVAFTSGQQDGFLS